MTDLREPSKEHLSNVAYPEMTKAEPLVSSELMEARVERRKVRLHSSPKEEMAGTSGAS